MHFREMQDLRMVMNETADYCILPPHQFISCLISFNIAGSREMQVAINA